MSDVTPLESADSPIGIASNGALRSPSGRNGGRAAKSIGMQNGFVSSFNQDGHLSATLPATWYYDPAVLAEEREQIFFKTWQFVGLAQHVEAPNSFMRARIQDQELLITRDQDSRLRAFYNICTHRGALLTSDEQGCARRFTCPYHGWTFASDGELRVAANAEDVLAFNKADYGLIEVLVEELAGMVFVNLDENAAPLSEIAAGLEEDIRGAVPKFDELRLWRRDPATVEANWKIVVENFLECYHCTVAHPKLMGQPGSLCSNSFETLERPFWSRHIMRSGAERSENDAYNFDADAQVQDGWIWMLWPNTLLMAWPAGSNFFVFHVIPDGPERTRETFDLLCLGGEPGEVEKDMFDYHCDVVNGEDIFVVEGVQQAIHARGYKEGRYMVDQSDSFRSEHGVHHFAKLVWNSLVNNSDTGA
jgi:phenylpropionate dioxygenase-like ring-hydroxylating dioxygenase large terminal subunit